MFLDGSQKVMTDNCKYENLKLDLNKDTNVLIDESYQAYSNTLLKNEINFKGKKLLLKTEKDLHTMKELGYEHIVSMKNKLGLRIYEKNRMIYVLLIEKIFNNCCDKQCDSIRIYKDKKDICIWCKKMDYLIVITERKNGYLLQTAYPIIYNHKRKEVEKKANENGIF